MYRPSKKEFMELIEQIEAGGGDGTELRRELEAAWPSDIRPFSHRDGALKIEREELTISERLDREVGDLFDGGISDEIVNKLVAIDGEYSLQDLQEKCRQAGISPNGHKKKLAAKLLAKGVITDGRGDREPAKAEAVGGETREAQDSGSLRQGPDL